MLNIPHTVSEEATLDVDVDPRLLQHGKGGMRGVEMQVAEAVPRPQKGRMQDGLMKKTDGRGKGHS